MTPGGTVTILHSFGDGTVGNDPQFYAGSLKIYQNLVQGPDGNFYSTSKFYGSAGLGTLFQITPQGTMLVLHSFGDGSVANDGNYPPGNLVLGSDGNFYGMTEGNYPNVDDVLFKFSIQSAPVITSSALTATATAGASYTFTCAALGSPAPTFSATPGTLPNGLTISSTGGISGTPTTPGTFTGTITAGNGIGTPATQSFTITVTDTYSAWATRNGLSGPAAAMTAVTANDGLNNLYKYSLGLAPATTYNQGDSHLPLVSSAANYLSLTFSGVATDVTYTVQASSDLTGAWTTIQTFPSGGVAPGTQTVQDTQSMSASSQRYMRLLMSSP